MTELLQLRCPLEQCKTIVIPTGTDLTSFSNGGNAGSWGKVNGVLVVLKNTVSLDANKLTLSDTVGIYYAQNVGGPTKAAETWKAGEPVYFDGTAKAFTNVKGNLSAVGVAAEAKTAANVTSGPVDLTGEIDPDVTP